VLVLDRAAWHSTQRLRVPDHIHLLFPPTYSLELQPAEHLWPLTNTVLVNRHFASIDELEEAQAARCVALQARPDLVRSTTLFHWWPQRLKKHKGQGESSMIPCRSIMGVKESDGPQAPDITNALSCHNSASVGESRLIAVMGIL
jgi:hypothetical protein